jgi:hypothetical protein
MKNDDWSDTLLMIGAIIFVMGMALLGAAVGGLVIGIAIKTATWVM